MYPIPKIENKYLNYCVTSNYKFDTEYPSDTFFCECKRAEK